MKNIIDTTLRGNICRVDRKSFSHPDSELSVKIYSIGILYGIQFFDIPDSAYIVFEQFENFQMGCVKVLDIRDVHVNIYKTPSGIPYGHYAEIHNKNDGSVKYVPVIQMGSSFYEDNKESIYAHMGTYEGSIFLGKNKIADGVTINGSLIINSEILNPRKVYYECCNNLKE